MATDREMLEKLKRWLGDQPSDLTYHLYREVSGHLTKPQPASNSVESWLACDGDGYCGIYTVEPVWDADHDEFDLVDGEFIETNPDNFPLLAIEPGRKVKVRLTVDAIGEPVKCDKPLPVWTVKDEEYIGTTAVVCNGADCYRVFGRDHVKRAAELAEYLNSKGS